MRVNHPRSTNQPVPALTAVAARRFDRISISGGERISSTERQLIEACVRAIERDSTAPHSGRGDEALNGTTMEKPGKIGFENPISKPNQSQYEPNPNPTKAISPTLDHARSSRILNQSAALSVHMEFNSPVG